MFLTPTAMAAYGLITIGGSLAAAAKGGITMPFLYTGMGRVGKTTGAHQIAMNFGEDHSDPDPTDDPSEKLRMEVSLPGTAYPKVHFTTIDIPGENPEYHIPRTIMNVWPRLFMPMVDVNTWKDTMNTRVLKMAARTLTSSRYRLKTNALGSFPAPTSVACFLPWRVWTGKGWVMKKVLSNYRCSQVVFCVNKIDLITDPKERAELLMEIYDHYFDYLRPLRTRFWFRFIGTTMKGGMYVKWGDFGGKLRPLEDLFEELIRKAVKK